MAPLITISIHALLSTVGLNRQYPAQEVFEVSKAKDTSFVVKEPLQTISTYSWGMGQMGALGVANSTTKLVHKYWDGSQWKPNAIDYEDLGDGFASSIDSVSWGTGRLDIFARSAEGELVHKYYDGSTWQPTNASYEVLSKDFGQSSSNIASISWGPDRLDIFGIDPALQSVVHKYYDGSAWQPSEGAEDLGGAGLVSGVSAVSWGKDHMDLVAASSDGVIYHLYFDGSEWSDWEDMQAPGVMGEPTIISWGENRLDIFTVLIGVRDSSPSSRALKAGGLYHTAWDGSQWLDWECLGGGDGEVTLVGAPAAVSWSENRLDIVALGSDGQYYYKFYDGSQWRPAAGDEGSKEALYPKGGSFKSVPSLVSWGENRLDIYGVLDDATLGHQTWYGSGWYPGWGFERLGGWLA